MFNHPGVGAVNAPSAFRAANNPLAFEFDRSANTHIRELLRHFGLRTSLIRFKVINALVVAGRDGHGIGVNGVHTFVESSSPELSFVSVREVLKRLGEEGLIVLGSDKTYRFSSEAMELLQQHTDHL
ncbi:MULTISPECIES: fe2+ zn2+ uptake regulation protein [Pseudomonas]|uniref:fe2+ zn2+ uptake regulation protein n=1 Tax=Pseudomonas TaxID=286 RepID=UPI000BA3E7DB|nr:MULTISPECIES: fe2+ zn2+ uptake regulation protein [Pseudomonas]MBY8934462.1 fe2+ zn2+ uptake regulation protein [Pseudomonas fluorescens]